MANEIQITQQKISSISIWVRYMLQTRRMCS